MNPACSVVGTNPPCSGWPFWALQVGDQQLEGKVLLLSQLKAKRFQGEVRGRFRAAQTFLSLELEKEVKRG